MAVSLESLVIHQMGLKRFYYIFRIEIIDHQPENGRHSIKANYGFFAEIIQPKDLDCGDEIIESGETGNPFRIWLKARAERTLRAPLTRTTYLKECF